MTVWSNEQDAIVKEMWGKHIAEQIGIKCQKTKGAVIGRANRLGLEPSTLQRGPRKIGYDGGLSYAVRSKLEAKKKPARPIKAVPVYAESLNIPFDDLEPAHCRWVTSEEGQPALFCGNESVKGHPYCGFHCHMAYEPARPRAAPYHYYNAA